MLSISKIQLSVVFVVVVVVILNLLSSLVDFILLDFLLCIVYCSSNKRLNPIWDSGTVLFYSLYCR